MCNGLDLGKMHGWIVDELDCHRPVSDSMTHLVGLCRAARPHPDWERLLSLLYDDTFPIIEWIWQVFGEEPAVRPLRGLWFGLFNPSYGRRASADIYVCGSGRFEPDPRNNDWAVGPSWVPEGRCAESSILDGIYRIACRDGGLGNDAEYPLCLGYGAFVIREVLGLLGPSQILGRSDALGVAVGFDSGDFVLLGEFGPDGWVPRG